MVGQSGTTAHDSSSVTKEAVDIGADQDFAVYQHVSKGVTPPKATHAPDPQYPDLPVDTEPRGLVVMLVGVDARGHVGPVRVLRSSAPVFEKSAVETVKKWKFKPAREDGKAVPVQITVEMKFEK
jgi:protein TonB